MTLTLHGSVASRALRPLWVAEALGLPMEHVPTAPGAGTRTAEFLQLNPNGHVPVLVDERPEGPLVLWESMACVLYLARHYGKADGIDLSPATPAEDAEALRWSFWAITEVEADALTVLYQRVLLPADKRQPDKLNAAEARLRTPLAVLESHLGARAALPGSDPEALYLAASRFTVADLCLASVLDWCRSAEGVWDAFPHAHAWLGRCTARADYRAARARGRPALRPA